MSSHQATSSIWYRARSLSGEIGIAWEKEEASAQINRWIKSSPPPARVFLLNTDGAYKASSQLASAGGLIPDSEGRWIKGFVVNIGHTDSLSAELWGIREGPHLAKKLELPKVIVEMDATAVGHFLRQGVPHSHHSITLINDAIALTKEGWVSEIRHILPKGNQCVDFLVNLGQSCPSWVTMLDNPPPDLLVVPEQDAQRTSNLKT